MLSTLKHDIHSKDKQSLIKTIEEQLKNISSDEEEVRIRHVLIEVHQVRIHFDKNKTYRKKKNYYMYNFSKI